MTIFFLILSMTIDSMVAGFSIGINKIKVHLIPIILMNFIGTTFLVVSIVFGNFLELLFPNDFLSNCCSILLIMMGIGKIMESIKKWLYKKREIHIRISNIECIFHIYAHPELSDIDLSKELSIKESILLACALSLDNLVLGFSLTNTHLFTVVGLSLGMGLIMFYFGNIIGRYLSYKMTCNVSWLSGVILIFLSLFR